MVKECSSLRGGCPMTDSAREASAGVYVGPNDLRPCLENLAEFVERYTPHFVRAEQRGHAATYIEGLLSDLHRKTIEPIAMAHDQPRRPLQRFVGAGGYDD